MEVIVEHEYTAKNFDELTIKKGDRIKNVVQKEEGWFEGELVSTGRRGVFPDNFVKQVKSQPNRGILLHQQQQLLHNNQNGIAKNSNGYVDSDKPKRNSAGLNNSSSNGSLKMPHQPQPPMPIVSPPPPPPPSSSANKPVMAFHQHKQRTTNNPESFNAKVLYSYVPVNDDELSIQENDIVQVLRLVEDGWYEGIYNGKKGVFPSNYVERIPEPNSHSAENENSTQHQNTNEPDLIEDEKKGHKKFIGIGFGNIFSGNKIELKTQENLNHQTTTTIRSNININTNNNNNPNNNNNNTNIGFVSSYSKKIESELQDNTHKKRLKARALFEYTPVQPDELKLSVGEIIYILDKNVEDEGWWRGESIKTGRIGLFPDNFVEEIADPLPVPQQPNQNPNGSLKKRGGIVLTPPTNSNSNTLGNNQNNMNSSSTNGIDASGKLSDQTSSPSSSNNSIVFSRKDAYNGNKSSDDNLAKSQSDISEELDEIQQQSSNNKLTHIKKTRQFNKRPPSFKTKTKEEHSNNSNSFVKDSLNDFTEKTAVNNNYQPAPTITTSPPNTSTTIKTDSVSSTPSNQNQIDNSILIDELKSLKLELDTVKKDSSQFQTEFKSVQTELLEFKKIQEEQTKKMQRKLQDLINEIDEEKKTRLALQVELERLKKTIMNN